MFEKKVANVPKWPSFEAELKSGKNQRKPSLEPQ